MNEWLQQEALRVEADTTMQAALLDKETAKIQAKFVDARDDKVAEQLLKKDLNWEHSDDAALFFVFRAPSQFTTRQTGSRTGLSVKRQSSNIMVHPLKLDHVDGGQRSHVIDAIGETTSINYEIGDETNEFAISARIYQLVGEPQGLTGLMVSDSFIEKFHDFQKKNIHRNQGDDIYRRREAGFNRVVVNLSDGNGNQFSAKDGDAFILPIIIKRGKFIQLSETDKTATTLNVGAQVGIPVSRPFNQLSTGAYANLVHRREISDRLILHLAAGFGANLQRNIYGGYSPSDRSWDLSYNTSLAAGISCLDKDKKGKTSLILSYSAYNPLLKNSDYRASDSRGFVSRQSRDAVMRSDRAIGLGVVRERGKDTMKFECQQDFGNRSGLSRLNGNNNRDFSCNLSYARAF